MAVFDIARGAGSQLAAAGNQLAAAGNQLRQSGSQLRTASSHLTVLSAPQRGLTWTPDFYETPESLNLRRHKPGDVLRCEQMRAYLLPGVPLRARAFRILYRSTGAVGEPTAVSGTVLLPENQREGARLSVIAYAPGTHGIGDGAAPSRLLSSGRDWEATTIAHILAGGYAVAVTDYQGLGTPGDHAFMVGRALGNNVLDVIRAAVKIAPEELSLDSPCGIIGYSEGGAAAAWAAQLHPKYAPELELAGVAAGAAAADMQSAVHTLDGHFASFFLTYGAIGYAAAYPELDLEPYLTEKGKKYTAMLRDSNIFQAALHGPRFTRLVDLTSPNVLDLPEWSKRLAENRLGTIAPTAPVLLHHARHDQIVAPEQSRRLMADWRALGADVRLRYNQTGVDHITGGIVGAPLALGWLSRRIDRVPVLLPRKVRRLRPAPRAV